MKQNLYELMEISPEATPEEIKAAMMRLGKIYATKGQMNTAARTHFNRIKKAYKILSNSYRRGIYDESLKQLQISSLTPLTNRFKQWVYYQWEEVRNWKHHHQQSFTEWKTLGRQKTHAGWQTIQQQAKEGWQTTEQQAIQSWQLLKQQAATKYISQAIIPGEIILYQAITHWFFYFDFGAVLLVLFSSYLLITNPNFLGEEEPMIILWTPAILSKEGLELSVWHIGLIILLIIGLLVLWEVFILKQTTELAITSKRVIAKLGLFQRTIVELKLRRFESITIEQSLLGRIFNYGNITITGMGGMKTTIQGIEAPLKFKKVLWQVLEYIPPATEE